jgi:hypothetical protein
MSVPFSGGGYGERFRRPTDAEHDYVMGRLSFASPGFLDALGVQLLEGRLLLTSDNRADCPRVVVINRTAARTVFAGDEAVGQPVRIAGLGSGDPLALGGTAVTVVAVATLATHVTALRAARLDRRPCCGANRHDRRLARLRLRPSCMSRAAPPR